MSYAKKSEEARCHDVNEPDLMWRERGNNLSRG